MCCTTTNPPTRRDSMTAKQAARDARNTMIQLEKVKAERDRLKALGS